ncbi:hypothetical protein GGR57DRAFT_519120 [Xylariaceae sp. FL1272]|nr:hypothetical protein GGR57DRAFT_519120 [Xylariaceae sp. FL1272]
MKTKAFHDNETILRLARTRHILAARTKQSQRDDLLRIKIEIDAIIREIKLRGLLNNPNIKSHARSINSALSRARTVTNEALNRVLNAVSEEPLPDDEVFIAKANDLVSIFRGHCLRLRNGTNVESECRSFKWYLSQFPHMNEIPPAPGPSILWKCVTGLLPTKWTFGRSEHSLMGVEYEFLVQMLVRSGILFLIGLVSLSLWYSWNSILEFTWRLAMSLLYVAGSSSYYVVRLLVYVIGSLSFMQLSKPLRLFLVCLGFWYWLRW